MLWKFKQIFLIILLHLNEVKEVNLNVAMINALVNLSNQLLCSNISMKQWFLCYYIYIQIKSTYIHIYMYINIEFHELIQKYLDMRFYSMEISKIELMISKNCQIMLIMLPFVQLQSYLKYSFFVTDINSTSTISKIQNQSYVNCKVCLGIKIYSQTQDIFLGIKIYICFLLNVMQPCIQNLDDTLQQNLIFNI
eukprot:TRINITY_DN63_c0_g1_i8.p3 TRINITY_DN63_c0_g1~~TRINITY_DN63_c0_g1_i8.p3  ORF type:complete len:194 (-),score=-16.88 TRINITY_DN63_c0_g1_i8:23-604(-)